MSVLIFIYSFFWILGYFYNTCYGHWINLIQCLCITSFFFNFSFLPVYYFFDFFPWFLSLIDRFIHSFFLFLFFYWVISKDFTWLLCSCFQHANMTDATIMNPQTSRSADLFLNNSVIYTAVIKKYLFRLIFNGYSWPIEDSLSTLLIQ